MSEQGDWHFVEEDIGPALKNKTASSTLSDASDENLQFMEASLTEPFFQTGKEDIQLQLPTARMNCIEKLATAGAVQDEGITTEEPSDLLIASHQKENKDDDGKKKPSAMVVALTAGALIVLLLAGSVVVSSLIYARYTYYPIKSTTFPIDLPSSILFRPPPPSPSSSSRSAADVHSRTARLPESSSEGPHVEAINSRLDRLEIEVLSASNRLNHHDLRLTSLESEVTELTEMILKISSCGAHFYKTNPDVDFSKAVHGGKCSKGLFVEARTKIYTPHGSNSKDLIHASHQCINDDTCLRDTQAEKIDAGGGGDGTMTNIFFKNSNDAKDDAPTTTLKFDIDELRVRITSLEHRMDALHSLLSSSSDGVDQELATFSATISKLQEKVEELEGIW